MLKRHKRGFALRNKFKYLTQHQVFKINECCILKGEFSDSFKNSKYYSNEFVEALKFELKVYNRNFYQRLKFNDCVHATRVSTSVQNCKILENKDNKSNAFVIQRFDLNFAYISAILCPEFVLPTNSDVSHWVGDQAHKYCQYIKNDRSKFVIVK